MTQDGMTQTKARLATETEMGAVTLKVADLDNMIRYYTQALPLNVIDQQGPSAIIGRGNRPLVILEHSPELKHASPRAAGLFVINDNVRKVDLPVKTPFSWVPYARVADRVAIPYEPIKSDYQITIRLLEALLFYKDKVVFDDRVNNELIKYTESIEHWKKKSQEAINDIRKLYEVN